MKLQALLLPLLLAANAIHAQKPMPQLEPSPVAEAAGFDPERLQRIDKVVQEYVDKGWIGGGTVLVARNGKIAYHKAFGWHDDSKKTPMKVDEIFRIASQTKAITSVAVMMLFEEGKFLLDDNVSKYIPEFRKPQVIDKFNLADTTWTTVPAKREITIRDLLTHTSGLGYAQIGSKEAQAMYAKSNITAGFGMNDNHVLATDIKKLGALPLFHQPGEKYLYGLNTDVLGYLVEVVSGMPLDQFFRTRIFEPLGMKDTYFYLPANKYDRLSMLYMEDSLGLVHNMPATYKRGGAEWNTNFHKTKGTYFSGGAGLASTAYDYSIFMQMLLNRGTYFRTKILSPNSVDMMTQNQIGTIDRGPNDKFGLGFGIVTDYGTGKVGQSEGTFSWGGAFSSTYFIDPKEKIVAQLFLNQSPNTHGDIHEKFKVLIYSALNE